MPTIPKQTEPSVALRPISAPTQNYARDPASFGGNIGQTINRVGSKVSNTINEIQLNELALQNETKAKELDVEFSQALRSMEYDPKDGYYSKRGKDAYEYQPLFNQATEELYNDFVGRAENQSQKMMLEKVLRQRVERAKSGVIRHANKEYRAWIDGASASRIKDNIQEAAINYSDPKYVEQLRASGRNELIDLGQRNGKDQEEINNDIKEFESTIHIETIDNMIQHDVKLARAYFEENKDEIDGTEHNKILRALKVAEQGDLATDLEHYSQLNKLAAFDPETFITTDLTQYTLSQKDYKKFDDAQKYAQLNRTKLNDRMSGVKRAMQLSTVALKSAGIDTTPKEGSKAAKRLDEFQGALLKEIEQFRTDNNNNAPTDSDMLHIVDALLIKGKEAGSGWFGTSLGEDKAFMFETGKRVLVDIDDIPDSDIVKIKDAYKRLQKREPTKEEIREMYTQKLYLDTRGGK